MSNEPTRRVAQLPGFDTAPDVYETADNDDSTTTSTLQTSPRDASLASDTSDEESDEERGFGVSRRRLYPERARNTFNAQARGVETTGTDLSDRVDGKRRGLRIRRGTRYGVDDEDEEGLEARIARLKREVEECRILAGEEAGEEEQDGTGTGTAKTKGDVEALSRLLADIDVPSHNKTTTTTTSAAVVAQTGEQHGHKRFASEVGQVFHDALPTAPREDDDNNDIDEHTLSRITAFDTRLAALESVLGISSVLDPTSSASSDMLSTPLLPSLHLLDQQLSALTSASSLATLEAATSRIAKLKLEAQSLSSLQHRPPTADTHSDEDRDDDDEEEEEEEEGGGEGDNSRESTRKSAQASYLTPDDAKKLEGLYTLLPSLQSLAPTVPALITRLRSLRTLHSTAATAAGDLDAIEQRQTELDRELKMWREGLERVEHAVKEADTANGRNGNFVQSWVKDLEGRMKELGR